ncbi:MAG TPA: GNAT family N-acetyltransferase [Pyrinomonadaceae bacterium]|jgi:GNAT superfamily N-acetyltransferase
MKITFRQIKDEDFEFLWRLHNAALKDYVTQVWGWDEQLQREMFAREFSPNEGKIILVGGRGAGFFRVIERERERVLVSIRLLPEFQKKGIGTKIIKDLLNDSKNPVRLQVLKINPARALYERLGFEIYDETETHFLMKN